MFFATVGLLGKLQDQAMWDALDALNDAPPARARRLADGAPGIRPELMTTAVFAPVAFPATPALADARDSEVVEVAA